MGLPAGRRKLPALRQLCDPSPREWSGHLQTSGEHTRLGCDSSASPPKRSLAKGRGAKRNCFSQERLNARYSDREELVNELDGREGTIYRIGLVYAGKDPRIARSEDADLKEDDLREIRARLERYDRASRRGDWTHKLLGLIANHPMLSAGHLAAKAGVEKEWLKINVRKLKSLRLTPTPFLHQRHVPIQPCLML